MIYENRVFLTGIVVHEPILNTINEKTKISNFILKTVNTWIDKKSNSKKFSVKWHKIICWDLIAEQSLRLCKKGNLVSVVGEISYYQKKNISTINDNTTKNYPLIEIKAKKLQAARLEKVNYDNESENV